jgi:hypothetical protein
MLRLREGTTTDYPGIIFRASEGEQNSRSIGQIAACLMTCLPGTRAAASVRCDRLPRLDAFSFRVGEPAELSILVAFAFSDKVPLL